MDYLSLDIPERKGIYLFLLPKLKVGYVGSSNNLKKRYKEHTTGAPNGNKHIKNYLNKYFDLEYMILEFCDGYNTKDLKLIESNWIQHYRKKGVSLLNRSEPKNEPTFEEPKAVVAYDKNTLEFVGEWGSLFSAAKAVKGNIGNLSSSILERKQFKGNTFKLTYKGYLWFHKENFSQEILYQKKQKYDKAIKHRSNVCSLQGKLSSKKINQYSKEGSLVKTWNSARDVYRELGFNVSHISSCALGKRKSASGYIWRFPEESECIK